MEKYKYPYKHHFAIFIAFTLLVFLITCFIEFEFTNVLKSYVVDRFARISLLLYIFFTNLAISWTVYIGSKNYYEKTGKNIK